MRIWAGATGPPFDSESAAKRDWDDLECGENMPKPDGPRCLETVKEDERRSGRSEKEREEDPAGRLPNSSRMFLIAAREASRRRSTSTTPRKKKSGDRESATHWNVCLDRSAAGSCCQISPMARRRVSVGLET